MATTARLGFRAMNSFRQPAMRFTQQRTFASAADTVVAPEIAQSRFQQLWNSKVGPKTVHFWAPIMKWGLVLAGASDFARPASEVSLSQNAALMATGLIWTRWCFVIRPKNLFLASVNFLLFCVGTTQVGRVLSYQKSLEGQEGVKKAIKEEGRDLESAVKDPKSVVDAVKGGK